MRVHYIQHVPFETPAGIKRWADTHGHSATFTNTFETIQFPTLETIDALVIMGGPMSAYDDDTVSWLGEEKKFIHDAIRAGKKVLGICLGAQLIANVLGARVYPGKEKEIGWFPVWLSEAGQTARVFYGVPAEFTTFHWHGDTFDLPPGATNLARSELTPCQAFALGKTVLALQFHFEMSENDVQEIAQHCQNELLPATFVQSKEQIFHDRKRFLNNQQLLVKVLDNFFAEQHERS